MEVVLTREVPRENLNKGDRALYIHELHGVNGQEDGAILELDSGSKAEWRIAIVPLSAIAAS